MTVKRGEVWLASLDPVKGSEQAGTRPVLIFQNDLINKYEDRALHTVYNKFAASRTSVVR